MINEFIAYFQANQMFAGLVSASVAGASIIALKSVPQRLFDVARYMFTSRVIIRSASPAYDDVIAWLSRQPFANKCRRMSVVSNHDDDGYNVSVGYGTHAFIYSGRLIVINRTIDGDAKTTGSVRVPEVLSITAISRNRSIIAEIVKSASSRDDGAIGVFAWTPSWWRRVAKRTHRPIDSVILPRQQRDRIVEDVSKFLQSERWYRERNVPYRRGYLFYGPPGTGKTSLAFSLASHFKLPIYAASLNSMKNDADVLEAFISAPPRSIMLIEDIDAAMPATDRLQSDGANGGVTLSGLLNAIDGVASPEERILIMTTNYKDRLDGALIRTGRADVHELIGELGDEEITEMAERFGVAEHGLRAPMPASEVQVRLISMVNEKE